LTGISGNLHKAISLAKDDPRISKPALEEACDNIFVDGTPPTYDEYQEMVRESYKIDMEEYARVHNFFDAVLLAKYFCSTREQIEMAVPASKLKNRILVIGCGQGRLADIYIALAQKMGITEITFNDLIPDHIEQTKARIEKTHGSSKEIDGVKLRYLPGDFVDDDAVKRNRYFDAIFMMWYVSAELLDPTTSDKLKSHRNFFYNKINDLLITNGVLIEDSPDPNMFPGFHAIANIITAHILETRKILTEENVHRNLMLTNWKHEQKKGFPRQLRFTPRNGQDSKEKEESGLIYLKSESIAMPENATSTIALAKNTIDVSESTREAIEKLNILLQQTVIRPREPHPLSEHRKIAAYRKTAAA